MIAQIALFVFFAAADTDAEAIRAVLDRQQDSWNRGDIPGFMAGYENSERLIFTSGGSIHRGWKAALDRYLGSYPDREAMGRLAFSGIEVTLLGTSAAVVLGKWELTRKSDHPHGVFTLVFEKKNGSWKIIHDHTSQAREP